MVTKMGRNDPCWCGSGRKYKRCHLHREKQDPPGPWEVESQLKHAFSSRECSVPHEWRRECSGKIVRAHTVPRAGSLKTIAKDGHVYAFVPSFSSLGKHGGRLPPQLYGINRASTFTGFCAEHDRRLFSPLENLPFSASAEQCFLLGYRALSREVYMKEGQADLRMLRKEADKGRTLDEQWQIQTFNLVHDIGIAAGLRDNQTHKREYDQALVSATYDEVRAYVVMLADPPDVMCSGGVFPERDFADRELQDPGDIAVEAQLMTVSAFASEQRGYVVLAWLPRSDGACRAFVESLESIPDDRLTSALLRFFFESFENVFLRPSWWESLSHKMQSYVIRRMSPLDELGELREGGRIVDDGTVFPPWNVLRRWRVGAA